MIVKADWSNTVTIPSEFRQPDTRLYPVDNTPDFEFWFSQNHIHTGGRIYLGVLWTSFYKSADFGNAKEPIRRLQNFLNRLDRSRKYFTCCQFDNGILNDLSHLDIKVFSMSGRPMDYPLPLLCQPHAYKPLSNKRHYFANFIGSNTHPIRSEILNIRQKDWFIDSTHHKLDFYCSVLASSIFTLAPRGYGPSSFRIVEAMQYGSIPVYISDRFIIPHLVPFNTYGVLVRPEQIPHLPEILGAIDIPQKQAAVKRAYANYYTFESTKKLIERNL